MKRPVPSKREEHIDPVEMFFSMTDKKGIITSTNHSFNTISGYTFEQSLGNSHSIVRHPEMPKTLYKFLWDDLNAGNISCCYFKNMTVKGNFYWVVSVIFPVDKGYFSIQMKPSSSLFQIIQKIYPLILEEENKKGVDSACHYFLKELNKEGFSDYKTFISQALISEIVERQKIPEKINQGQSKFSRVISRRHQEFFRIFKRVATFPSLNKTLENSLSKIMSSFCNARSLSINMSLASGHLGKSAATLVVVSESFQNFANETHLAISNFNNALCETKKKLHSSEFKISCVFLQNQTMAYLENEISCHLKSENIESYKENLKQITKSNFTLLKEMTESIRQIDESLLNLCVVSDVAHKAITALELVRQTGTVEAAQISGASNSVFPYLEELQKLTQTVRLGLREITEEIDLLQRDIGNMREEVDNINSLSLPLKEAS